MPAERARSSASRDAGQTGAEPGRHGKFLALIKRKPLEAVGAAAGVAVIGLALWKRHQNQNSQAAPGDASGYLAPPGLGQGGGPAPGGSSGPGPGPGIEAQIEALQDQLDQLDRARHHRPRGHDHDRGHRRPPPRPGGRGERMHPGAPR